MNDLDKFTESAKKFMNVSDEINSFRINSTISNLANLGLTILVFLGVLNSIKNLGNGYFITFLSLLAIYFLAAILKMYNQYKTKKILQKNYEEFLSHMNSEGFSKQNIDELIEKELRK